MKILVINDTETPVPEQFLGDWVGRLSKELSRRNILPEEKRDKELSLVFLKEMDAKQLNWNFRQRDYATDVLSFDTEDPESFGELVFCPLVLQKQAKEHKVTFDHELGYMVLHGVLHLLGFDHEKDETAEKAMLRLQDEVFETLTAPPPKPKAVKKAVTAAPKKAKKAAPVRMKKNASAKKPDKKPAKKAKAAVVKKAPPARKKKR